MTDQTAGAARLVTNVLNPFVLFTALYTLVAFARVPAGNAVLYVSLELLAAAVVAGYVFLMRRRKRVGDFWISARAERLVPAVVLLAAFVALLAALGLLLLGPLGLVFLFALPLVVWSRIMLTAHTLPQTLAGTVAGALSAALLLS